MSDLANVYISMTMGNEKHLSDHFIPISSEIFDFNALPSVPYVFSVIAVSRPAGGCLQDSHSEHAFDVRPSSVATP